ncbi:MAG: DUF362 domain-containing protein [Gemmatimonadota bacterium]|nr:DUF362 domain-containing protein [Gemmatimonadota bacterium]
MKARFLFFLATALALGLVIFDIVTASRSRMIEYRNPAPDAYFYETGSDTSDYPVSPEISAQVAILRSDNLLLSDPVAIDRELTPDEIKDMVYKVIEMDANQATGLTNLQKVIADKRAEKGDSCWVALKLNLVFVPGIKHTLSDQTDQRITCAILRYLAEETEATRISLLAGGSYSRLKKEDVFTKYKFNGEGGRWGDHFKGLPDDFSLAGLVEEIQADNPDKVLDIINLNYDELYKNGMSYGEMTSSERRETSRAIVPGPVHNNLGPLWTINIDKDQGYNPTKAIYKSDILVVVPKLKTTGDVVINNLFKNYIGSVSRGVYGKDNNRGQWLQQIDHDNLWETCHNLFSYHPADYVLVDALNCMEGEGSHPYGQYTGYMRRNFLVAGGDPVAVESICVQSMGFHPGDIDLLRWGRAKGWGYYEPNRISILGDSLYSVTLDFKAAVQEENGDQSTYYYGRGCTRWLLCGPFEDSDLSSFPGGADPATLNPKRGDVLDEKSWTPYISPGTVVDLQLALESTLENTTVCAFTRIYSPEAQEGKLWVGATEGIRAWINGELVIDEPDNLGYNRKKFEEDLSLAAGDNRILLLLSNSSGDFGFSLACVNDGSSTTRESAVTHTYGSGGTTLGDTRNFTEAEKKRFFGGRTLAGTFYHLASGPGENVGPEKLSCDIDGNGQVNIVDVIKFLLDIREESDAPGYDRNGDGIGNLPDAVALMLDILRGDCPEQQVSSLASAAEALDIFDRAKGLSRDDIQYVTKVLAQMNLTSEQEAAFRIALYGKPGKPALPKSFSLAQNSPNPFNPATTISYSVPGHPAACNVSIKVYNLRGVFICTLVDAMRVPGAYSVFWNGMDQAGRRVPSGVYLYSMQAGEFVQTRKMVLLK